MLDLADARGGWLLTAGERRVVAAIRALSRDAADAYARLTSRVPAVFLRAKLGALEPLDELDRAGLTDDLTSWEAAVACFDVPTLRAALVAAAVTPTPARRAAVIVALERARGAPAGRAAIERALGFGPQRFLRVRHRALIRRLERLALASPYPDRSRWVRERLGVLRWPSYAPTPFVPWFRTRKLLVGWERSLVDGRAGVAGALRALDGGFGDAPGPFHLRPRLLERVVAEAAGLVSTAPADALALLAEAERRGAAPSACVMPRARALERLGRCDDALAALRAARPIVDAATRIEVDRTGRRLARSGWPPSPPLRAPPVRDLDLVSAGRVGPRPGFVGDGPQLVEAAVRARLARAGRRAVRGESSLWVTLFALMLVDDGYFLPVPGALPDASRSGPIDLGTPAFAAARPDAARRAIERARDGTASAWIRRSWARHQGERVAGVRWSIPLDTLGAVVDALGPTALAAVVGAILADGWAAAAGLPDLVVLPGPACALDGAFPSRLGPHAVLVEVKGPGDTVRPGQAVWFDRLIGAGAPVELWRVRARDGSVPTDRGPRAMVGRTKEGA